MDFENAASKNFKTTIAQDSVQEIELSMNPANTNLFSEFIKKPQFQAPAMIVF
jgi:hypothetical protein